MDKYIIKKAALFGVVICILLFLLSGCMTFDLQDNSECIYGDCENGFGIKRNKYGLFIGKHENNRNTVKGIFYHDDGEVVMNKGDKGKNKKEVTYYFKGSTCKGTWETCTKRGKFICESESAIFSGEIVSEYDGYLDRHASYGEILWKDGSRYKGELGCVGGPDFIDCGLPKGQGEYITKDGLSVKGLFKNSSKYGIAALNFIKEIHYRKGKIITDKGKIPCTLLIRKDGNFIIFTFEKINLKAHN